MLGASYPLTTPVRLWGGERVSASIAHGESGGANWKVYSGAEALGFISIFGTAGASYKQCSEPAICRRRNRVSAAQANITGRNRLCEISPEVARSE